MYLLHGFLIPYEPAVKRHHGVVIRYELPVLWMTSCLPIIGHAELTPVDRLLKRLTEGSTGPGTKYDVYDCVVSGSRGLCVVGDGRLPRTLYSLFWSMFGLVPVDNMEIKYPAKGHDSDYASSFPSGRHATSVVRLQRHFPSARFRSPSSYVCSLMNRFRTGQGPRRANLHKWGLVQSPSCDCGQRQTMYHIVDTCPLTKIEGGPNLLHEADDDAVMWLESTATAALAK